MYRPAFILDPIRERRETKDTRARREEMACVVVCVEAEEIGVEDSQKNLSSDWEDTRVMGPLGLCT